jgi:hypothetical protein
MHAHMQSLLQLPRHFHLYLARRWRGNLAVGLHDHQEPDIYLESIVNSPENRKNGLERESSLKRKSIIGLYALFGPLSL